MSQSGRESRLSFRVPSFSSSRSTSPNLDNDEEDEELMFVDVSEEIEDALSECFCLLHVV